MNKSDIKLGLKTLKVKYQNRYVGTLASTKHGKVAFSYDDEWLKTGFSISPFSLPLEAKVFVPDKYTFDGLFGIFADSLPDAWGRLLLDKMLKEQGMNDKITVLDRLALVGKNGMGALEYEPDYVLGEEAVLKNFDYLAQQCEKLLQTEYSEELDLLYKMGGSSGGARPKILTNIDDKDWIIKFPAHVDSKDIGYQEYCYSMCAKECGINMTETKLFSSEICKGYFGTVRFDRIKKDGIKCKIHTASTAALLEADYKSPCLDYHTLMKLTRILTRENKEDLENMFRRMCFNVFAHNRDDHAKNFSFLYDESMNGWRLSPSYDLTYSNTYFGEHTTCVDGNGANPGEKEMLNVGIKAGMKGKSCISIMEQVKDLVAKELKVFF